MTINTGIFQETHIWFQTPPAPHWIQLNTVWLPKMPAASFLLSNSTSGLFHSGLAYHVSGTSKSLAELSEMLPGGRGQNKVNKERTTPGGRTKRPAANTALTRARAGWWHGHKWRESTGGPCLWRAVPGKQRPHCRNITVGPRKCLPAWVPLLILQE